MVKKKNRKKNWKKFYHKYIGGNLLHFLWPAITGFLIFVVAITFVEANENTVATFEGIVERVENNDGSGKERDWISFEIDGKAVYVLDTKDEELIQRLARERVRVIVTYPTKFKLRGIGLLFTEFRSQQIIQIVDALDGTVYFDVIKEHNTDIKVYRIVILLFLSSNMVVSFGLIIEIIYDTWCVTKYRKNRKKQKQQAKAIRASETDLTLEQRKHASKNKRRKKK